MSKLCVDKRYHFRLNLLKKNGYLGYIVPSKFTKVGAGTKLRELLKKNKFVETIVSFGANQIFQDKTTYTCLMILKKDQQPHLRYLEIKDLNDWKTRNVEPDDYDTVNFSDLDDEVWILIPGYLKPAYINVNKQSISLEELLGTENIYNGIQTSANNIYIHSASKEDDSYVYFSKDGTSWKVEKVLTRPYFKTSNGEDNLNSYRAFKPNSFVIYPYLKTVGGVEFVKLNKLRSEFPHMYKYVMTYKDQLGDSSRDIKPTPETNDEWYRYGRHQSLEKCDVPAKIIVGVLSQGNKYAIDYYQTLISSGGTAGYCMITLPDNCDYSIYYIQALLNSKYIEWYSSLMGEVFRGGYIARGTKVLKRLPVRIINFSDTGEKNLHNSIASIQKNLIKIQGQVDANFGNNRVTDPLQREFDAQKNKLDNALIRLYNLGDDDNQIPMISKIYEAH